MKNSCYFCDFCEICGLTEALPDLFSFQVQNFVKFVVLPIFSIFVAQSFHIGRKILVTFAVFYEICGHLEALLDLSSFPLLCVEFCEIYYSCYFCHICCSIFSHSMKNSCYFCDFCEICGLTNAVLDLFSFQEQNFVQFVGLAIFADHFTQEEKFSLLLRFCEICGLREALLGLFSLQKQNFEKFVISPIFAIFVIQSFHIARKILLSFTIFATFAISSILF